jgi:hypothetical protein
MSPDFFISIGNIFRNIQTDIPLQQSVHEAYLRNPWFTESNTHYALQHWAKALSPEKVIPWLNSIPGREGVSQKNIGIMMAGNIPLVGLHDLLCVLAVGHRATVKLSSDDEVLMKYLVDRLSPDFPALKSQVVFSDKLKDIDAAIATGSNNSARYFEYYFRNIPNIIRKNRNSVAVITPDTSPGELEKLGDDIFRYFGLGCRNVTHLFLPEGFDPVSLFPHWENWVDVINHHKYANNYTYHKAILLMNLSQHLDNGFVILQESDSLYSPVGLVHYSYYSQAADVEKIIAHKNDEIQCIVGVMPFCNTAFGGTQQPWLSDYADGVDIPSWLISL